MTLLTFVIAEWNARLYTSLMEWSLTCDPNPNPNPKETPLYTQFQW